MICVSIQEPTTAAALARMRASLGWADLFEVRLDGMVRPELRRLVRGGRRPVIATCRPASAGGARTGSEDDRLALLRAAAREGAAWVDVEVEAARALGPLPGCRRLVSHHEYGGMPSVNLGVLLRRLERSGADAVKIAAVPSGMADVLALMALPSRTRLPLSVVGMGPAAAPTRVLYRLFDGAWTYAAAAAGRETAPGQIPAQVLAELYRAPRLGSATEVYGLVGDPVAHSVGPAVWNRWFAATGRDAVYVPFRCCDERDLDALLGLRRLCGLSVTIPHKERALARSGAASAAARAVGAANTLFRSVALGWPGRAGWSADNTDSPALAWAVERLARAAGLELAGASALVLGAGGAARAAVHALAGMGCRVAVAGRTPSRARSLARDFASRGVPVTAIPWRETASARPALLVNATPVGMAHGPDGLPVSVRVLRPGLAVFDTIYNPAETPLVLEARRRGGVAAGGFDMFVRQAALQAERWGAGPADERAFRRWVKEALAGPASP